MINPASPSILGAILGVSEVGRLLVRRAGRGTKSADMIVRLMGGKFYNDDGVSDGGATHVDVKIYPMWISTVPGGGRWW